MSTSLHLVSSEDAPAHPPAEPLDDLETTVAMLSGYILADGYGLEDWQDSPAIPALRRLGASLAAAGRELPPELAELLKQADAASP